MKYDYKLPNPVVENNTLLNSKLKIPTVGFKPKN